MALGLAQRAVTLLALTSLNRLKPSSRHGAGASFFKPDRRSAKDWWHPALLDRAVAEFGHIDILVNTPDWFGAKMLSSSAKKTGTMHEPEYQERILHVSGSGETLYAQGNGGKIINIASMLSFQGGSVCLLIPHQKAAWWAWHDWGEWMG